jgi:predicted pyridoxine 5'-phosphate oxidase superfamily flavin-nucleotide-binding protein
VEKLSEEIISFFERQNFVIVATLDKHGGIHTSCKSIIEVIRQEGRLFLLDLYQGCTRENLLKRPKISITAVDEHKFKGYCLKGSAYVASMRDIGPKIRKAWEQKLAQRLVKRLLKNIKEEKGHPSHPEAMLPEPQYLIVMQVEQVVDLTPGHLKGG